MPEATAVPNHVIFLREPTAPEPTAAPKADRPPAATSGERDSEDLTRLSEHAAGTRATGVVDDILRYARGEIESFLEATEAVCNRVPDPHADALRGLSSARGDNIRADLTRLSRLSRVIDALDQRRAAFRQERRSLAEKRDRAHYGALRRLIAEHDNVSSQLTEVERRRAEALGEIARVALRASGAAKALYAQVSVLAGQADGMRLNTPGYTTDHGYRPTPKTSERMTSDAR